MRTISICIALFSLFCMTIKNGQAQNIVVKSCMVSLEDNTADVKARYDINNDRCALIKVVTNNIDGLVFTNPNQYVGDIIHEQGTYYVYVSPGTYMLSFSHNKYQPGIINLANFGYKKKTQGGKTYIVELKAPPTLNKYENVIFKVSPVVPNCYVVFDGNKKAINENGLVEFYSEKGDFEYRIQADNYKTIFGRITVSDNIDPISVTLMPITISINISCNVKTARVFVDNIDYGSVGERQLPIGKHNIRISANGYFDINDTINIDEKFTKLNYTLRKNKNGVVDIHPVTVFVYSNSSDLYLNNERIPGWANGGAIMLMPNTKCRLSNDKGRGDILSVGNRSLKIVLSDEGKIMFY